MDRLELQCVRAGHIIGHNILRHDLPHIVAQRPHLARLSGSVIDTLWLNPLAFPRNPYHHLVKHYQDGRLQAGHINDPEADARLVFDVLDNQIDALTRMGQQSPDTLLTYHFLTTRGEGEQGFDALFRDIRGSAQPSRAEANSAVRRLLQGKACSFQTDELLAGMSDPTKGWPAAYALSWISVAGGDSVMPPWVRAQFRDASHIVRRLRDTNCHDPSCEWCRANNDPVKALERWFGFPGFRPEPADAHGVPLQERIVAEAMAGQSVLGILPTGTGKSVCYQVPALSKFDKTGALTVVISPLVALMSDQVAGLQRVGVSSAVTVNGMLSVTERQNALDLVRMGDASMLIISPEQLRSISVRSVLRQREVGLWVLDEAHCVSKWGHDFRPDYRYVSRFVREYSGEDPPAPVLCLTATAKPDVVRDIRDHFESRLGVTLELLDGGAVRTNLSFAVEPTQKATKLADIVRVIEAELPAEGRSGAIVYCATQKETERVAAFLSQQGMAAAHFHSAVPADTKREVQESFQRGDLRVIAATNAFGMGIDKPDIRLVVHGDIPGSLENYLQEAGRAGRDRQPATCVLLYSTDDVERQFSLSARSRLARHEIGAILKALRRLDLRMKHEGEVVATPGEIVRADDDREFYRDKATDDTRVKTAVAWLEEAKLLTREENRVQVFPSSLRVRSLQEAGVILDRQRITGERRSQLMSIVRAVMAAAPDEGISTDHLAGAAGLALGALRKALADLETLGIASNDTAVTVFVHYGVEDASTRRLDLVAGLEKDLVRLLREAAPDADPSEALPLSLTETSQALKLAGHVGVQPPQIEKLLRSMAMDGRDMEGGMGNLALRKSDRNSLSLRLLRTWSVIERVAELRHQAARTLLGHLLGRLQKGQRGKDIQVETTLGHMLAALNGDAFLRRDVQDMNRLMDRALLWMHEQNVVLLGRGLVVFRPAMTVNLTPDGGPFTVQHFAPLEEHYTEQTVQTHVMATYAEKGLVSMPDAMKLSEDYFVLEKEAFLARWLPDKRGEVRRQTTGTSYRAIVDQLGNPVQEQIVRDDREQTNVLVLAGPGSGKTRVLVHRIAYLVRVKREDPRGILCLTYNRHAAAEVRERLRRLIGEEATFVTVKTCHALAMRLVGASFAGESEGPKDFDAIIRQAVALLRGEGLTKAEAEAQRDALIEGYRWILVDEYQDVGPDEYELIAAVAGRTQEDPDLRLSLFAVGDDDQNIYAFTGASVAFIRRFEQDYAAKPVFLTENYRSTANIVAAANAVIAPAKERMKAGHDISVNRVRAKDSPGGALAMSDPVAQGRVQYLSCPPGDVAQAIAVIDELIRLSTLDPEWQWRSSAIIAREWRRLDAVRAYAELKGIPVEVASEKPLSLWKMREMQAFVRALLTDRTRMLSILDLTQVLNTLPKSRWTDLIGEGIGLLARDVAEREIPVPDIVEWFGEWSRDVRGEQRGLLLLTAHRAKGLEFDHVAILDGGWDRTSREEDPDAPRRLFYVAMTRARKSLVVLGSGRHALLDPSRTDAILARRAHVQGLEIAGISRRYVAPDPRMVDLSFAGRAGPGQAIHAAIRATKVGDPVSLRQSKLGWVVTDMNGAIITRMAKAFVPPDGTRFVSGTVGAILTRRREDNPEEFQDRLRIEEWEVVLPDLVFDPTGPIT